MQNEILKCIIMELGPTGLLIIGLYFIILSAAKEIKKPLTIINHNTSKLCQLVEIWIDHELNKKQNGKS